MTEKEQINALSSDLGVVIDRYRSEFDITYAGAIGALSILSHILLKEATEEDDE